MNKNIKLYTKNVATPRFKTSSTRKYKMSEKTFERKVKMLIFGGKSEYQETSGRLWSPVDPQNPTENHILFSNNFFF